MFANTLSSIDDSIRIVCRRYHCNADDAEEFAAVARLRLIENDYAILRKFGGRCSLRTYLSVVVGRMFLDFRRQRWGVWRPSTEARRLGAAAVRLDVMLHRDGLSLDQAIQALRTNEGVALTPDELAALAARLPSRGRRRRDGEAAASPPPVAADDVERAALVGEREARARALRTALHAALAGLGTEDALILRLRFSDDFTVARIATTLGLEAKPLYRRLGRLLQVLRAEVEARGFRGRDLHDVFGLTAWDDDEDAP